MSVYRYVFDHTNGIGGHFYYYVENDRTLIDSHSWFICKQGSSHKYYIIATQDDDGHLVHIKNIRHVREFEHRKLICSEHKCSEKELLEKYNKKGHFFVIQKIHYILEFHDFPTD